MKKLRNLVLVFFAALSLSSCSYNTIVEMDESVGEKWAQVQTQYQRRSDLIPNLVSTVKGYADFEKSTLTAVTQARANATGISLDAKDLTPENIAKFQAAQNQLSGALSRLLVSMEKYPDLKANQNFLELQAQLEGTENRIAVSRKDFNDATKAYNTKIRKFPANLTAMMFSFEKKAYFEADQGAQKAPAVSF